MDLNGDGKQDWKDDILLQELLNSTNKKPEHEYDGKGFHLVGYIALMILLLIFKGGVVADIVISLLFWPWYLKQ